MLSWIAVYALYNKSRVLLGVLSTILLGEIAYLSYNLVRVTPQLGFSNDCFVTSSPSTFVVYWCVCLLQTCSVHSSYQRRRIVSLAFETLLFGMTLWKFFVAVKDGWGRRPIMREFVSDGTWAYALIFGMLAF